MTQNSNIRRIDELGRIVIPKDIRKKLHMKENEPLEIYIEDDGIKIKKYSYLPDIIDFIKYLVDIGSRITGNDFIVTDREAVIAASIVELQESPIGGDLEECISTCQEEKNKTMDFNIGSLNIAGYVNMLPIIIDNDRAGLIIEVNKNRDLKGSESIKIIQNLIESRLNNY